MENKGLVKGISKKLPDLEDSCPILPLTKTTKNSKGTTIDVSNTLPGVMLQMNF